MSADVKEQPVTESGEAAERRINMIEAINDALGIMLERDPDVIVMGEDVGYFGGVFRCTRGCRKSSGRPACSTRLYPSAASSALRLGWAPMVFALCPRSSLPTTSILASTS